MEIGNIIHQKSYKFEDLPNHEDLNLDSLYFKSRKYTLSNKKMYTSEASYRNNLPVENKTDITKVINSWDFWKNLQLFSILKKIH